MSVTIRCRRPAVLWLLLWGALALGACRRDEGPQRLARAESLYAGLVERGVPPGDPAYDAVIAQLESVPRDSKAWSEAQRRLAALRALRSPLPPRPLARPGMPEGGSPSLDEHGHPPHLPEDDDGGT